MSYQMDFPIAKVLDILNTVYPYHPMGDVTSHDPYKILICALLSIRNRDIVTMPICARLFSVADTPEKMLKLSKEELISLIYPVKFYLSKADTILSVSQDIMTRFQGQVPDDVEMLDTIKGVGRKTANLVVALGFGKPAISVDTHVHRICNRLGYVQSKTPEQTEQVLRQILPARYWSMINRVMVRHGQDICHAVRPLCDRCPVFDYCEKVGVKPVFYETVGQVD